MQSALFALERTLPDSGGLGDVIPLAAIVIVAVAALGIFAASQQRGGSSEARDRITRNVREFAGLPTAGPTATGDAAAEEEEADQTPPWGNLDLAIYDERDD